MRTSLLACLLASTLAAACASVDGLQQQTPAAPPAQNEPGETSFESIWDRLASTYDSDGDGRITPQEHGRDPQAFARLDQDGDGCLEASDFQAGDDGIQLLLAQILLGRYLQDDDRPEELTAEELESAFAAYDGDGDAALTREEFELQCDERSAGSRALIVSMDLGLQGEEAFAALAAAIDRGGDGALDYDELMAFHGRFLSSGRLPEQLFLLGRDAVGEGELAPDFALEPARGEGVVRLSSFRGSRPVALIFGSYT